MSAHRRLVARAGRRAALAAALVPWLCAACRPPVVFALVEVLVREPVRTERLGSAPSTLILTIDDAREEVTFDVGAPLESSPVTLGQEPRVVTPQLIVGDPTVAAGQGDPFTVPALADVEGTAQDFARPLILAAPDVPELLDDQVPTARSKVAVCSDPTRRSWFFGGVGPGGARLTNGYAFSPQSLTGKTTVVTDLLPGELACDADGDGGFVLVEGGCESGTPGAPARLSVGREAREPPVVLERSLCDPHISVASGQVWVASRGRVQRFALDGAFTPGPALDIDGLLPRDVIAMSEDVALVAAPQGVLVVRVDGDVMNSVLRGVADPIDFVRRPSGEVLMLIGNPAIFTVDADGQMSKGEVLELGGMIPQKLELLPDGRTVVLGSEGIVIEGSGRIAPRVDPSGAAVARDAMVVTVGGAVLLVGGGVVGTDVLVPAPVSPAAE